jgi:hypothetical protein
MFRVANWLMVTVRKDAAMEEGREVVSVIYAPVIVGMDASTLAWIFL